MKLPVDKILQIRWEAFAGAIEAEWVGELVRCRDCKHWYADAHNGMVCEYTNMWQPNDGFCNWGERKGGDSE